ncbi:MAG TPA: hypothetical protein VFE79_15125, partial [Paraburkholderia sp.]|nr:hypothetical protein [Paraburkholderia sp.]
MLISRGGVGEPKQSAWSRACEMVAVCMVVGSFVSCGGGGSGGGAVVATGSGTGSASAGGAASGTGAASSPGGAAGGSGTGTGSATGGNVSGSGTSGGTSGGTSAGTSGGSSSTIAMATDVLMHHNDLGRTGQMLAETTLTLTNVTSARFGKVAFLAADGKVDAQPLFVTGLSIGGASHDVVYVATEHDS